MPPKPLRRRVSLPTFKVDPKDFGVDSKLGFVGRKVESRLPEELHGWVQAVEELGTLLSNGTVREVLDRMPELDYDRLDTPEEHEYALLVLSMLASAYINGPPGADVAKALPEALAFPLCHVAGVVGRPPILSYSSFVLHNCVPHDPESPLSPDNVRLLHTFMHSDAEKELFRTFFAMEVHGGAIFTHCATMLSHASADDDEAKTDAVRADVCTNSLNATTNLVLDINALLQVAMDVCERDGFANPAERLFQGWPPNEDHAGVVYTGAGFEPEFFFGPNALQSSVVHCLRIISPAVWCPFPALFLVEMRKYMPQMHRDLLGTLESGPSMYDYVQSSRAQFPDLEVQYVRLQEAVREFYKLLIAVSQRFGVPCQVQEEELVGQDAPNAPNARASVGSGSGPGDAGEKADTPPMGPTRRKSAFGKRALRK